jgi:hypothetical protein
MSRQTFEQLRIPAAILLVLLVVFFVWPRDDPRQTGDADPSPSPSVVVGEVGGVIVSPEASPSAAPTGSAIPTSSPEPSATSAPTPAPAADGFGAEVLACRSISGSRCNGQLGTLPASAGAFTALVRFSAANAGDELNAVLTGPSGTLPGFPYVLQGSGDGYYYTQFQSAGLAGGTYTLTATRNGQDVAVTTFRIAGN